MKHKHHEPLHDYIAVTIASNHLSQKHNDAAAYLTANLHCSILALHKTTPQARLQNCTKPFNGTLLRYIFNNNIKYAYSAERVRCIKPT